MKVIAGRRRKAVMRHNKDGRPRVAFLDMSNRPAPKFKGFSYTVEEGIVLSKRSYSEIPGLLLGNR